MQGCVQQPIILCLTDQSIVTSTRCWKCFSVRLSPLDEMKTILKAALVASKENTSFVVRVFRKLGSIRNPISDYASHFHGVGIGPGVDFANMRAQRTYQFINPFVSENICGPSVVRVIFWIPGDWSSCQSVSARFPSHERGGQNTWTHTTLPPPHQLCAALISTSATCRCEVIEEVYPSLDVLLELAKSEKTAVNHPIRTPLRVCFYTILRPWRFFAHGDNVLIGLHVLIPFKGYIRVDAFQEGLRDSISKTEAEWDLISMAG